MSPLSLSPLLDHVDGPEEGEALGGLTCENLLDSRVTDVGDQRVEAAAAELLKQGGIDRLRAVVMKLGEMPAIPGPAEIFVQLSQAGSQGLEVDSRAGARTVRELPSESPWKPNARCAEYVGQLGLTQRLIPCGTRERLRAIRQVRYRTGHVGQQSCSATTLASG